MQGTLAERACCGEGDRERETEGTQGLAKQDRPRLRARTSHKSRYHTAANATRLNDSHFDGGHSHVGVIKTLCLLMLSWIFTDEFRLRVVPKAGKTQCRRRPTVLMRFFTDEHRCKALFVLLSVCSCLPDEQSRFPRPPWDNMFPLTQIIIFRWSFKLVDFYLHIFSSNLLHLKWKPTDGKRDVRWLKRY